jgi:hypothetical protein
MEEETVPAQARKGGFESKAITFSGDIRILVRLSKYHLVSYHLAISSSQLFPQPIP